MAVVQNSCCVFVYAFTHMHLNSCGNTPVVHCNISSLFLGAAMSRNEAGNSSGPTECNYPMSKFQPRVTIHSLRKQNWGCTGFSSFSCMQKKISFREKKIKAFIMSSRTSPCVIGRVRNLNFGHNNKAEARTWVLISSRIQSINILFRL